MEALYETVIAIAEQRAEELRHIRDLLVAGDEAQALRAMRTYVGLPEDAEHKRKSRERAPHCKQNE
jgi:hypothetical protein